MEAATRPSPYTRRSVIVFLGLALTFSFGVVRSPLAHATPPLPNQSAAYYVESTNPTDAYNTGEADGKYDTSHGYTHRDAILDFGGQVADGSGTQLFSNSFTNAQIEMIAEQYAVGYWAWTNATMNLAIATNNSLYDISNAGGVTWASVARTVWSSGYGVEVTPQVTFWGGNDIETWTTNTTSTAVEAWAQGWNSSTGAKMVNFGDAAGCSTTATTSGNGYTCSAAELTGGPNNHFTQHDYWYLSQGLTDDTSVPEVYAPGNSAEWEWICLYGNTYQGKKITFQGPLSNWYRNPVAPNYTPTQTWSDLWNSLNGTACAQTPTYLIDTKAET
jgi:hypothetical protein